MTFLDGAIGPGFFTPEQEQWRSTRQRIGGDDPNAGSYHLSRIHWNKETGTGSFSTMDTASDGWLPQPEDCGCEPTSDGGCGCH